MAPDISVPINSGVVVVNGRRYLSPEALGAMLGVSTRTLARWHDARVGPPKIMIGRKTLYDEQKLTEWLATHKIAPLEGRRRRATRVA